MRRLAASIACLAALAALSNLALAQSDVAGWGFFRFDSSWCRGPFTQVQADWCQSMAIRPNGSAVAWGLNWNEMCQVPALPPGVTYLHVDGGEGHTVGLRSDGSVLAWGDNQYGQCNVPALPPGVSYAEVAAGWVSNLARRSDGQVVAWGANWWGECNVPALPPGLTYVEVAIGYDHALGRRSDGSVVAWGANGFGQCNVPALPPGLAYRQISCRGGNWSPWSTYSSHSVALRSDGSAVAWGSNDHGQCNVPALPPGVSFRRVGAGQFHTIALLSDDSIIAWGDNTWGQCDVPAPPTGRHYVSCSAGETHNLALLDDGEFVAWGLNRGYECSVPQPPSGLSFSEVSVGGHVLARVDDGSVIAWGVNDVGQCDVPALPPGQGYVEVDAGGVMWMLTDIARGSHMYSLARRSDGTLVAWGSNSSGQCNVPALPVGLTYVEAVAGDRHALARRSNGSIVAWGDNTYGQCNVPALPPGLTYVELAASVRNSAARRSDGSIVVWGDNANGQCNVPALPPGLSYVEVASGLQCTLARRSDGSVICWGDNSKGQLNVPGLPPGLSYVEIAAGAFYSGPPWNDIRSNTLARRSDGSVVAWGDNINGQCNVPELAPGLSYQGISAIGNFTVARVGLESGCPPPTSYCIGAINSTGRGAHIGWQGTTSVAQNDFVLLASGCPPKKPGIFFFGKFQHQIPFGEGYLCITGFMQRLLPAVLTDAGGSASYALDFTNPASAASLIEPGSEWNFQLWYRDPQAVGHGFNLTDALHAAFCE